MEKHTFTRTTDESLILVKVKVNKSALNLALDTGATHTVIDTTALLLANCRLSTSQDKPLLETASGIVTAELYELDTFISLGIQRSNFQVHAYDLIGNGVLTEIDGVLGLDFLENHKFCVDLGLHEITVTPSR